MKVASPLGKTETAVAQKELENFQENTKGVTSAVLLSTDGFEVASLQVNKESASRLAAMGSSLAAISSAIAKEAGISECSRLIVESDEGVVAVMKVPNLKPPLALAVVANDASLLGQLLWGAKNCCAALEEKLKK
jgi:predicted regulator of Ras-like GTPase activity (Roadblock/LC7/MglB family)